MQSIELESSGGARLTVVTLGAAVDAWYPAPGHGRGGDSSLIVGWPAEQRLAAAEPYPGAIVGRYANRIAGAAFVLDGTDYQLVASEGPHTLHGGTEGFDRKTWTVTDQATDRVTLQLVSSDGDQGFPGELTATVTYALSDTAVDIVLEATAEAPTVVNLASHPYLDLGPEPTLTVPAARYLPVDSEGIPLAGSADVSGTAFDLRDGRVVGPDSGLDHAFLVDGDGPRQVARLLAADGRRSVTVTSDQPSLQVFTGGPRGVALEAQREPDGPHRPGVETVLRPGERYRSVTRWAYAEAAER